MTAAFVANPEPVPLRAPVSYTDAARSWDNYYPANVPIHHAVRNSFQPGPTKPVAAPNTGRMFAKLAIGPKGPKLMKLTHLLGFLLGACIEAIIAPKPKPTQVAYMFTSYGIALHGPNSVGKIVGLGDPS